MIDILKNTGKNSVLSEIRTKYDNSVGNHKNCTLVDLKDDLLIKKLMKHSRTAGSSLYSITNSLDTSLKQETQSSYPVISKLLENPESYDPRFNTGTRSKLLILNDKLVGFERQMELQAKHKRHQEENRLININESLNKLQNAITLESKRRMETIKALHGIFETQINSVQNRVENLFMQKLDQLDNVIQTLSDRIDSIQTYVNENDSKFTSTIETNCMVLEKNLSNLQKSFDEEKMARQEREEQIVKKLSEIEMKTDSSITKELDKINSSYHNMKTELSDLKKFKEESEKKLKTKILDEFSNINNGLVMESRAREESDNDIVEALHKYAKILNDYSNFTPFKFQPI
ncbi:filament assembling protein [Theileria orientalis strain Shintoku]|uniref:Filament assembling protein n=1 Tax=Theileria orientalis strain Shintoku TaxID=869250 RepID=J7M8J1_THEOR|nr:filament assembling protein [Theileria orientalis strain Shintoku]BAM42343.1 filament assembling protein [Theileria orientalis strain Shintoku]|eukprot:XP_009692644.1 filament assembling protein [Theileria orientalis strain Shintoku]